MLEQYKPKLYKKYRKSGYDLDSVIPERHERYEIVRNKVWKKFIAALFYITNDIRALLN